MGRAFYKQNLTYIQAFGLQTVKLRHIMVPMFLIAQRNFVFHKGLS